MTKEDAKIGRSAAYRQGNTNVLGKWEKGLIKTNTVPQKISNQASPPTLLLDDSLTWTINRLPTLENHENVRFNAIIEDLV